jgi:hypothetical protein
VDVLHHPHRLLGINGAIDQSRFVAHIISHIQCGDGTEPDRVDPALRLKARCCMSLLAPARWASHGLPALSSCAKPLTVLRCRCWGC